MNDNQVYENEANRPEVIAANAEAKRVVLEARAKLHPAAQIIYTIFDSAGNFVAKIGCLLVFLVLVLSCLAPQLLQQLLGR